MRVLLDSHALLWSLNEPRLLSSKARLAIEEPLHRILVGAVSVYEFTFKHRLGKLEEASGLDRRGGLRASGCNP